MIANIITNTIVNMIVKHGPSAGGSRGSGAVVVDWNQELLHIVRTPGAQPATVHPTRNFAILQAAIYDAVVSITHDAPPLPVHGAARQTTRAPMPAAATRRPRHARRALSGHETGTRPAPHHRARGHRRRGRQDRGVQVGALTSELILALRAHDGSDVTPPPLPPATRARTVPADATQLRSRGLHALGPE